MALPAGALPAVFPSPIHLPVFLRSTGVTRLLGYHEHSDFCGLPLVGPFLLRSQSPKIAMGQGLWSGACPILPNDVRQLDPHRPQISPLNASCLPIVPFHNHFMRCLYAVAMSHVCIQASFNRLRYCSASSPLASSHLGIRLLRANGSSSVALHTASRRRSYFQLHGSIAFPWKGLAPL